MLKFFARLRKSKFVQIPILTLSPIIQLSNTYGQNPHSYHCVLFVVQIYIKIKTERRTLEKYGAVIFQAQGQFLMEYIFDAT